jgi:YhcN/YlaJ family sporulation lipoprotein
MKKKKCILAIFLVVLLFCTCGCGKSKKEQMPIEDAKDESVVSEDTATQNTDDGVVRAENIADIVVDLFGVEDATALIYNESVLVGVIFSKDVESKGDTKNNILDIIKENDTDIKNIYITDDEKLFNKIDDIEQMLIRGDKVDKYSDDINKIIKQIEK